MFGKKKQNLPEVYNEVDFKIVDEHINTHFGEVDKVFHEIVSPDIHVDIYIVNPTPERNYYTLVTCGMGAHVMNIPKVNELQPYKRAEVLIALPPDWQINNDDEKWYWPIRLLKDIARLPINSNTWIGYGHTVSHVEPFAENTKLCGTLITFPYQFKAKCAIAFLTDKKLVNFYQLVPLYQEEMDYKIDSDAESLEDLFPDNYDLVVDIERPSFIDK